MIENDKELEEIETMWLPDALDEIEGCKKEVAYWERIAEQYKKRIAEYKMSGRVSS